MTNTDKAYDSYSWILSDMVYAQRKNNKDGTFDIAYLDGAHSFIHDGLALCLLKELVKFDGYIIIDDLHWSYSKNQRCMASDFLELYTKEQLYECQVRRAVDMFIS